LRRKEKPLQRRRKQKHKKGGGELWGLDFLTTGEFINFKKIKTEGEGPLMEKRKRIYGR